MSAIAFDNYRGWCRLMGMTPEPEHMWEARHPKTRDKVITILSNGYREVSKENYKIYLEMGGVVEYCDWLQFSVPQQKQKIADKHDEVTRDIPESSAGEGMVW